MAVTLIRTIAWSTSNSLVSLADADSYHENLLSFATWDAISDDDKKRSLISASASFSELAWWGRLYDATTPLSRPRPVSMRSPSPWPPLPARWARASGRK